MSTACLLALGACHGFNLDFGALRKCHNLRSDKIEDAMLPKRSTEHLIIESTSELLRANEMERITVRAIAGNAGI